MTILEGVGILRRREQGFREIPFVFQIAGLDP